MKKLSVMISLLKEDVNHDESVVIDSFGKVVDFLFKIFLFCGIPFLFYVLLQFQALL